MNHAAHCKPAFTRLLFLLTILSCFIASLHITAGRADANDNCYLNAGMIEPMQGTAWMGEEGVRAAWLENPGASGKEHPTPVLQKTAY